MKVLERMTEGIHLAEVITIREWVNKESDAIGILLDTKEYREPLRVFVDFASTEPYKHAQTMDICEQWEIADDDELIPFIRKLNEDGKTFGKAKAINKAITFYAIADTYKDENGKEKECFNFVYDMKRIEAVSGQSTTERKWK